MEESVSIIIFNEAWSEVLLVKRRDIPVWVLPGGGVDPLESPEEAAVREAEEETGYRVTIQRKVAEYLPVNRLTHFTHLFQCRVSSGTPTMSSETSAVSFFPIDALPKRLPPPYPGWIRDAYANHPFLIRKKISGVSYWVLLKYLFLHPILVFRYLMAKIGIHLNS
jgi:8-oxo-dGTP diphosphatase